MFAYPYSTMYNIYMEITRATKIKINLDKQIAKNTINSWNNACNFASRVCFENGNILNPVKLHKLIYYQVKTDFGLSAQVTGSVFRYVTSKYKAMRTSKKIPKKPIRFNNSAVVLQGGQRERDFGFKEGGVSIWTTQGRIKDVTFQGEPKLRDYISNNDWTLGDAKLYISKRGQVFISVSFKKEVSEKDKPNDAVIGVDRGINNLATMTDGKRVVYFGGGKVKHVRTRYDKTKASLQRKKAHKNTRSLRRVLKRQSGKRARFMRDTNHVISKNIIRFAKETGNPTIAFEDLGGIRNGRKLRKEQRTDLNQWAYYQLEQFTIYKCENEGFEVLHVEAKNTSKGCSKCGHVDSNNRNRHLFLCRACGHQDNADSNASHNIRLRGIVARQDLADDAGCQPPLKHAGLASSLASFQPDGQTTCFSG